MRLRRRSRTAAHVAIVPGSDPEGTPSTSIAVDHDVLGIVRGQAVKVRLRTRMPAGIGPFEAAVVPTLNGAVIGAPVGFRIDRA